MLRQNCVNEEEYVFALALVFLISISTNHSLTKQRVLFRISVNFNSQVSRKAEKARKS